MDKTSENRRKSRTRVTTQEKSRSVIDFINELHTLPPLGRISIEIWDAIEGDWTTARPDICEDKEHKNRFVIAYLPKTPGNES